MTKNAKKELLQAVRARYLKANKSGKERILDEFVASTGYHRKYAIKLLNHSPKPRGFRKKGRPKLYQGEVVAALVCIWEICGRICSKRLKPFLPEIVAVLERQEELILPVQVKSLLLRMSRATIDRCLKPARFEKQHGLSTTKPGSLLKKAIPVRTFADWDDARPGFVEVDLVAHCGETVHGQYLNTLSVVDISTGWVEGLALAHRSQQMVSAAVVGPPPSSPRWPSPVPGSTRTLAARCSLYRYCLD